MNETDIRKYAELMKELGLTGLEVTDDKNRVRLERSGPVPGKESVSQAPEMSSGAQAEAADRNYISVQSPVVGVFYAAPAENADPYVAVGDRVKKGQTLCIVEAMKLMNEITADEDGEIAEVCAANGQVVEYGTELFRIRRQRHE